MEAQDIRNFYRFYGLYSFYAPFPLYYQETLMSPHPHRATALEIGERIALPFLLFTAVLAGMLFLSWSLFLPRLTRVDVNGKTWTAQELREEKSRLTADVLQAEESRRMQMLSVHDPAYQALKHQRADAASYDDVLRVLRAQAKDAAGDATINFDSLSYDVAAKTVKVTGDVRDAGPRSMTVLAAFIEQLCRSSMVDHLDPPAFTRADDAKIGPHSPFIFTVYLP